MFDRFMQYYNNAVLVTTEWSVQGMASLIPNNSTLIADGSVVNGWPPLTGANINALITNLTNGVTFFSANSNAVLTQMAIGSVNPVVLLNPYTSNPSGTGITNVQAISFCDKYARPTFDFIMQMYFYGLTVQAIWGSQGLAALLPNSTDLIVDGSAQDGRPPITDGNVNTLITNMSTFFGQFTANSNALLNQACVGAINP